MLQLNSYILIIAGTLIIIISYFFGVISKRTNIPSVLLLIILGIGIKQLIRIMGYEKVDFLPVLEILGIIGLIMIVLEAALDLELKKDKWPIIWQSFLIAAFSILLNTIGISSLIYYVFEISFFTSIVYAVPLSIISSAIVIPSINNLPNQKKEFLVYESTFSDILGIMLFYFVLDSHESSTITELSVSILINIILTLLFSGLVGFALVYIFQKIKTNTKLFLLIAMLMFLYSVGKLFHLSSLIIVLVFGLFIVNPHIFFRNSLKNIINKTELGVILEDLRLVTIESSFVIRTFFFVIFGITIQLLTIVNVKVLIISAVFFAFIFIIRYLLFLVIKGRDFLPEIFIAPRGLISILLYFSIPKQYIVAQFESGILLLIILLTSMMMTVILIRYKKLLKTKEAEIIDFRRVLGTLKKQKYKVKPVETKTIGERRQKNGQ